MARYIDADKVMEEVNRIGGHNLCEWETIGVKALIDRQPTADVVPKSEDCLPLDVHEALNQRAVEKAKSEVAREIFEEIEKELKKSLAEHKNQKLKYNIDDALFHLYHGITASQMGMLDFIAELKKKYTGEKG